MVCDCGEISLLQLIVFISSYKANQIIIHVSIFIFSGQDKQINNKLKLCWSIIFHHWKDFHPNLHI